MQRRCAKSSRQIAQRRSFFALLLAGFLLSACTGCRHYYHPRAVQPPMQGLMTPRPNDDVQAMVTPPIGWKPQELKFSDRHTHQIWLSPTGDTAYGVIRFRLPLPVGYRLLLNRFLAEMRRVEQTATLLSKQDDPDLPGIRFVAESAIHRVRVNMTIHGFRAWAFYAGTVVGKEENKVELELAERAREATAPGLPEDYQSPPAADRPSGAATRPVPATMPGSSVR
jgi:hypothetical protein